MFLFKCDENHMGKMFNSSSCNCLVDDFLKLLYIRYCMNFRSQTCRSFFMKAAKLGQFKIKQSYLQVPS